MSRTSKWHVIALLAAALTLASVQAQAADPLRSWTEGKTKQAIVTFVSKVTEKGSPDFVPPAERIVRGR